MKICTRCKDTKAFAHFYTNPKTNKTRSWCNECQAEHSRLRNQELRIAALTCLGGACLECGISDPRCLQIDHINGDGWLERRSLCQNAIHQRVIRGEPGYQLLCANCHCIKTYENVSLKTT